MSKIPNGPFQIDHIRLPAGSRDSPTVVLALCGPRDAEALAQKFAAMEPWSRYPYDPAALAAYLGGSDGQTPRYAITSGVTLAGALGLRLDWLGGPYIQFLGILPEFQNGGLGRQVLDWTIAGARGAEARNVWVTASDFNGRALRFYERHGFERIAVLDELVRDGQNEVLLRRRL